MDGDTISNFESVILHEDNIKNFITDEMSFDLFISKLKTQKNERKIGYHQNHLNCIYEIDEIYYMITEYIVRLTYEDLFDNLVFDSFIFCEMVRIWTKETFFKHPARDNLYYIVQGFGSGFHTSVVNFFIYFMISNVYSIHGNNRFFLQSGKKIYDNLIDEIIKRYAPEMSRRIAINKIKRNKIYNLGLGLKLSIRSFQEIM
jgi:hypothetical protein